MTTPFKIQISIGDQWQDVLHVPVEDPVRFSSKPLKWLRYVAAVVFGIEGELRTEEGQAVEYEDLEPEIRVLRYHPIDTFRPVDPDGLNHFSRSEESIGSRAGFRNTLELRDQNCVVTGLDPIFCTASHLIPKSKGDQVRITSFASS